MEDKKQELNEFAYGLRNADGDLIERKPVEAPQPWETKAEMDKLEEEKAAKKEKEDKEAKKNKRTGKSLLDKASDAVKDASDAVKEKSKEIKKKLEE